MPPYLQSAVHIYIFVCVCVCVCMCVCIYYTCIKYMDFFLMFLTSLVLCIDVHMYERRV